MEFTAQLQAYRQRTEQGLAALVPAATTRPARLHAAMRYSLEAGGKRLRPVLTLAACDLFTGTGEKASQISNLKPQIATADPLPAAVAIECIHTYSLIHDDLPCMDNDDLRRGRPTAHKQFDEATALLAGDALLTLAFQLIGRHYVGATALCAALTREIADAAGSERLIGGQMEDLLAEKKTNATAAELEFIHLNKTAAMLTASLVAGGLCGGATEAQLATLRAAGRHLGLAFQIIDDILDATADTATLGKTAGKDAKAGKTTYVKLHGLEASRRHAHEQSDAAKTALARLPGGAPFLVTLVENMAARSS
ncbi:polyprenyl synthetase family protein [Opitutus sp. GAS368]|jgi:geranylgeranyl diphosphate synthase type II|uniref:polyprenyl synthetase family protein n=1 Tax=Opitutus sp. GAS368 TaxID=1882749 RepID=UPI00087D9707|nr:farnesyl diphosphate synthase [Opitutus sp. GAS368]SDR66865.1 farnesyl-diphosphate synthase [Opitutus sp. GAS368]